MELGLRLRLRVRTFSKSLWHCYKLTLHNIDVTWLISVVFTKHAEVLPAGKA